MDLTTILNVLIGLFIYDLITNIIKHILTNKITFKTDKKKTFQDRLKEMENK